MTIPLTAVGWIDDGTCEGLFTDTLVTLLKKHPESPHIRLKAGPNLSHPRTVLVHSLLATEAEWFLLVDADMVLRSDLLERLHQFAFPEIRPIVGALCFSQGVDGFYPTLYMKNQRGDYDRLENWMNVANGARQVDATGLGCLLVHRAVFEKMQETFTGDRPWFQETQNPETGRWRSEDITFCARAAEIGYKIQVITRLPVGHVKAQVIDLAFYENWVDHHRLIITGTPRTGTTYVYQLLRNLGIGAGHETVYTTVEPQPWALRRAEVSWMAVPHLDRFHGTVVHLVRDPLAVLNSFLGIGFFHQLDAHMAWTEYIRRQGIELDETDPVGSAQRFIIDWNRKIEPYADWRLRVEDLDVMELRRLLLAVNAYPPEQTLRWALEGVSKSTNSRTRADLSWEACTPEFRQFAKGYGYG